MLKLATILLAAPVAHAADEQTWQLYENVDPMSDSHSTEAQMVGRFDGETVTVRARCSQDSLVFDLAAPSDIQWPADHFLWTRVRLDQQPARMIRTTSDYTNAIMVLFSNLPQSVVDRAKELASYGAGFNQLMHGLAGQEVYTAGSMQLDALAKSGYAGYSGNLEEMASTKVVTVELPLNNGRKLYVPIALTNSTLRKMIRRCPMYNSD